MQATHARRRAAGPRPPRAAAGSPARSTSSARDTLYGRYWGCVEDHPFLHFELCYYQAIDWAIAHGLARVEAGAQGEHKLARGYLPVADPLAALDRRRRASPAPWRSTSRRGRAPSDEEIEVLTAYGPFRRCAAEAE